MNPLATSRGGRITRRRVRDGVVYAAAAIGLVAACSRELPRAASPPPPLPKKAPRAMRVPVAGPDSYWEPVDVEAEGAAAPGVELPIDGAEVVRLEGATHIWDDLGETGRDQLLKGGVVVLGPRHAAAQKDFGGFYMHLREQRVPYVVTYDALAAAVHVALERALAEVEDAELAPALEAFLERTGARLAAERRDAGTDIAEGLRLARGLVGVAESLVRPGAGPKREDLAPVVAQEVARIEAHAGPAESPLLGVRIDYARFAVPSGVARPGPFRALAWLGAAPLALVARTEAPGALVDVAQARTHARAAMAIARLVEATVDPSIHEAYLRVARLLAFVWGAPDDLSPLKVADLAAASKIDLANPEHIASVVHVDRVRRRALEGPAPLVFDGSGGAARGGIGMRVFGGHAAPDAVALAALVGPPVGRATSDAMHERRQLAAPRDVRVLPSTLDIGAWLGARGARDALREEGLDAYDRYDAALARVVEARPAEDAASRHGSVYASQLDALMAWAAAPVAPSPTGERFRLESVLAGWTLARHDARPFTRPRPARDATGPRELRVSGGPLPAFVEPPPDVVGRLVSTVRQLHRGLGALGRLARGSAGDVALSEVEDILRVALRASRRAAQGEPLGSDETTAMAALPARLAELAKGGEPAASSVVADVHADLGSGRVLVSATGVVEPAVYIVREPGTSRLVLAVGAHLGHSEWIEPAPSRTSDDAWRARLRVGASAQEAPRGATYASSIRVLR